MTAISCAYSDAKFSAILKQKCFLDYANETNTHKTINKSVHNEKKNKSPKKS